MGIYIYIYIERGIDIAIDKTRERKLNIERERNNEIDI